MMATIAAFVEGVLTTVVFTAVMLVVVDLVTAVLAYSPPEERAPEATERDR